jgi:hypothetical protein
VWAFVGVAECTCQACRYRALANFNRYVEASFLRPCLDVVEASMSEMVVELQKGFLARHDIVES